MWERSGGNKQMVDDLEESYPPQSSSQEAFGRALAKLGRLPLGDRIVTLSADVAVTTHLAAWINRKGEAAPDGGKPDQAFPTLIELADWLAP